MGGGCDAAACQFGDWPKPVLGCVPRCHRNDDRMGGLRPAAQLQGERAERGGGERARQRVAWPSFLFFFSTIFSFFAPLLLPQTATHSRERYLAGDVRPTVSHPTLQETQGAHLHGGGKGERNGFASRWAVPPHVGAPARQPRRHRAERLLGWGSSRISVKRENTARQALDLAGVTQPLVGVGRLCLQVRLASPSQPHTSPLTASSSVATARTCATGISSFSALLSLSFAISRPYWADMANLCQRERGAQTIHSQ